MKYNTLFYLRYFTIYFLSILYIVVGIKHFIDPDFFIIIVPENLFYPKLLVFVSGFFEVLFGVMLLYYRTRKVAAWGLILLLVAVFPANVYLYISETAQESLGVTKSQALVRMPFQLPLILIAYWHSLDNSSRTLSIISIVLFVPTMFYFLLISV